MPPAEPTAASIGKSVQIRGEVKGSEDLLIDGLVEGTITLTDSRLTIGPHAHVTANVSARDVVILGTLVGDVNAAGRLEIRAGASLSGDIRASRLSIEENAVFSGKVDLVQSAPAASATAEKAPHAAPQAGQSPNPAPAGALFQKMN